MATFQEVLTEAVNDLAEHGFDNVERIAVWQERLRRAAEQYSGVPSAAESMVSQSLAAMYKKMIEHGGILKYHPEVARFTLQKLAPHLRLELDRRILASADLIKLNRTESINKTLRRFSGWATSIPAGGSDVVDKRDVKNNVFRALKQLPYEERRVAIDQGHKLRASLSDIVAMDNNAIAVEWHSHYRQAGYNYREDHKERDKHVYAIRGNWAIDRGLMKAGPNGYYDEITAVGEEVFCRCYAVYKYNLRQLPDEMLTQKGKLALSEIQKDRQK